MDTLVEKIQVEQGFFKFVWHSISYIALIDGIKLKNEEDAI